MGKQDVGHISVVRPRYSTGRKAPAPSSDAPAGFGHSDCGVAHEFNVELLIEKGLGADRRAIILSPR